MYFFQVLVQCASPGYCSSEQFERFKPKKMRKILVKLCKGKKNDYSHKELYSI